MIPSEVLTRERATKVKPVESSFFGNGAMSRFVHLTRRVSSTATPEVEFSHSQAIIPLYRYAPSIKRQKNAK
jgi:hypothetical protein